MRSIVLFLAIFLTVFSLTQAASSSRIYCKPEDRKAVCPKETFAYMPVEGFMNSGHHSRFDSGCMACNNPRIDFYYNLQRCGAECRSDGKTACALTNDGSMIEQDDKCDACSNKNVEYYFQDKCPEPNPMEHVCTPREKSAKFCTREYKPVCATLKLPRGVKQTRKTFSNKCVACQTPNVISYKKFPCS